MRPIAFTDARVIDPASGKDENGTLLVRAGRIEAHLGPNDAIPAEAEVRDCRGTVLLPGLVDTRCFTGEPGGAHRESIETLGRAAAAGGITTLVLMPDAEPVIDDPSLVSFLLRAGTAANTVRMVPAAALTKGLKGEELAEIGLMLDAGATAASQGRCPIASAAVLRRAMTYARDFGIVVDLPATDATLSTGVMNASTWSSWLGLSGVPPEAETLAVIRECELARATRTRVNLATISSALSLSHIDRAKGEEIDVTASVSVNHLSLNENDVGDYRTFFRVEPPLRTEGDRVALVEALRTGTLDIVCSAHDPQDADTKRLPFADAAPGAIGLETLLPAMLRLYHNDEVSLPRLVETVTSAPASRFGLEAGTLAIGAPADLIIVDLDDPWVVLQDEIVSRSKNTAFENARLQGRVQETWVGGRQVFALDPARRR